MRGREIASPAGTEPPLACGTFRRKFTYAGSTFVKQLYRRRSQPALLSPFVFVMGYQGDISCLKVVSRKYSLPCILKTLPLGERSSVIVASNAYHNGCQIAAAFQCTYSISLALGSLLVATIVVRMEQIQDGLSFTSDSRDISLRRPQAVPCYIYSWLKLPSFQ